ncbi:MAG: (Fe-S)-binding protein [Sandaracinaceae bacterium]|nr:(Fe-S)-binding protein [Sandaracinaceae bacterium]
MSPLGMTLVFVVFGGAFAWSAVRRWRLLNVGTPEPRFTWQTFEALAARVKNVLVYALAQKKMPQNDRYRVAGLAHIGIFLAFQVLLLNSVLLWARGFDASFDFWGLLSTSHIVGQLYSFAKELSAGAAILGASVFVYYRLVTKPARMSFGLEGLLILFIIITMMLADYVYVGGNVARAASVAGATPAWAWYEPVGSALAIVFARFPHGAIVALEHVGFWYHATWVLAFANLLPYSKHFHILTVLPNVFAEPLDAKGKLPDVEDIEGKIENDLPIGVSRPEHFTWKHILDLYTCTECGRCSDNCPAYTTGKKLSPKHLTLALRDHLYDLEPHYVGTFGIDKFTEPKDESKLRVHGDPPEGYHRKLSPVDLVGDVVDPEVIWACTTCRACEEQCPVNISYVDKIVEMRRHEMMIKNEFPHDFAKAFQAIEVNGNPWNLPAMDRGKWTSELDFEVPTVEDAPDADVIYWVGCAANYDDQAKKVARSFAKLMHHAGVEFAIMGTAATCTGDPARRAGNEYLFQMLAQQNVEALNENGAARKKVVTACPHCFNTIANEYPAFGGKYDVVHHTELLDELIRDGKLRPTRRVDKKIAYHDSCYLGRYNEVYDSPRDVLRAIPGVTLEEVAYWNKDRGLCCGAGGAQMWKEEEAGKERVNNKRTLQLLETGADTIASACPFCMTMLADGVKAAEREDDVDELDVAQILERSIDFQRAAHDEAAE